MMKKEKSWLAVVLLIAAVLRFWNLEGMPPGLYHDEAYNGLDAISLVQGKTFPQFYEGWELYAQDAHAERAPPPTRFPIFFEGNYGREPLHVYLVAVSVWLFGNRPFAIRAVPALAGVLAVLATWLVAKTVWEQDEESSLPLSMPLLATFFVAILFPAIHFSRFGLRAMLFVPVECLAVYCFWRGYKASNSYRWAWFVTTGFFVGFGLYIYAAARLLPLLFVIFLAFCFWQEKENRLYFVKVLGVIGGTAVLTALPLLIFFYQFPYFFIFRIGYVANKGKGTVDGQPILTWLLNVGRVIGGLFWQGETHLRHNLPERPYLDLIQAGGFVVGLGVTIRRVLTPKWLFLWVWLLVMLLPTIMSGDAPHFGRMTGAIPPIAILIAFGVQYLATRFTFSATKPIMYAMLLLSLNWSIFSYFVSYANHPDLPTDFYEDEWQLGQRMAEQSAETRLYLAPTQEEMATFYFALNGESSRLGSFSGGAWPLGEPAQPVIYFVRPDAPHLLETAGALVQETQQQNGVVVFEGETAVSPPKSLNHLFSESIFLTGWLHEKTGDTLQITLYWETMAPMNENYTAYIHLLDDEGQIISQIDRPPTGYPTSDWQAGEWVMEQYEFPLPNQPYTIRTGFYTLPSLQQLGSPMILTP